MKTSKLLKKAGEILSAEKSKQRKNKDSLKEVLKQLKKRKRRLKEKLEDTKSEKDQDRLRRELAVIKAQRHKGLKALKKLK